MKRVAVACALVAAASTAGCRDTSSFSTREGESWCGSVVQGSFVRAGFAPDVAMRMSFDADKVTTSPGVLSTSDGLFVDAKLRTQPQLFHDPLSTIDFGEGRRKSYLYAADPVSGAQLVVVVSLMESEDVEVRVLRVGRDGSTDRDDRPVFGVFPLSRRKGTCFLPPELRAARRGPVRSNPWTREPEADLCCSRSARRPRPRSSRTSA